MQNACEPLHIQLNLNDLKVTVLNRRYTPASNLTAQIGVFDTGSKSLFREEAYFSMGPSEVRITESLEEVREQNKGILFVVLNLKDQSGKTVSHNVYWLSPDNNYRTLKDIPPSSVSVSLLKTMKGDIDNNYTFRLTNNSGKIAFFLRSQLIIDDEEVLPSYWSSNYITLAPSESTTLSVVCPAARLKGREPVIRISGWNVKGQDMKPGSR